MSKTRIDEILDFWIGRAADDPKAARDRGKLWYQSTPESDEDLRRRFGEDLASAERGELDHWQDTASGALALVILLDQFSRNLYRGTARAFANDSRALAIAENAIAAGRDLEMPWIGRAFLYHPFEHSERLDRQERSVELFQGLVDDAPPEWKDELKGFLEYAIEHCGVVRQFGRFPHRNEVMERQSTDAEKAYLDSGARRYGQ